MHRPLLVCPLLKPADLVSPLFSQHALFAILSFVSCSVFLGYFYSLREVVLLRKQQNEAFYWRNLIWSVPLPARSRCGSRERPTLTLWIALFRVPLILHAWVSSWSNLQASVLSSQKATKRHVVCPVVANTLYLAGFVVILVPVLVRSPFSSAVPV